MGRGEESTFPMTVPATTPGVAAQPRPRRADPCVFVIFGAGGDLTRRLLVPALGNLAESGLLPDAFAVIGVARRELSDEQFRRTIADAERELAPNGPAAERI